MMQKKSQPSLENAEKQLQNDNYSRMVVYLNLPEEGEATYEFLGEIRRIIGKYYEEDSFDLLSESNLNQKFDN